MKRDSKDWFATWLLVEFFLIWTKPIFQIIWLTICVCCYFRDGGSSSSATSRSRDPAKFRLEVETDEDFKKFWKGYFRYPGTTEYVNVIRAIDVPFDMKERGVQLRGDWKYSQEHMSNTDPWKLEPWMREMHNAYERVYGHSIWEKERYRELNKLSNLKKRSGFKDQTEFNWMINGYIAVSEDEYGYVGLNNVRWALEKANGPDFWQDPEIKELNRLDVPWDIPLLKDGLAAVWRLNSERRLREQIGKRWSFVGYNSHCRGEQYFYHQEPAFPMIFYGFIRIDKDKYLPIGLRKAHEYFEDVNGYPFYLFYSENDLYISGIYNSLMVETIGAGYQSVKLDYENKNYIEKQIERNKHDDLKKYQFFRDKVRYEDLSNDELKGILHGSIKITGNKLAAFDFLKKETAPLNYEYRYSSDAQLKNIVDSMLGLEKTFGKGIDYERSTEDHRYSRVWGLFKEVNGYEVWMSERVVECTKKEYQSRACSFRDKEASQEDMLKNSDVYLPETVDGKPDRAVVYIGPYWLRDYFKKYIFQEDKEDLNE